MAITFIAAAKSPTSFPGSTNNTSTCVIAKPTGTVNGHMMLAFIETGNASITAPAGWTLVDTKLYSTGNMVSSVYWKLAASEGASYTFTDDSADSTPLEGAIVTYSGVHATIPVNISGSSSTAGTDTVATPAVTTTVVCLMVHYRSGKSATVGSQGTFSATGTNRFSVANRGGSTQYFSELYDTGSTVGTGSQLGNNFNASITLSGSIERQIGLRDAVTVAVGADVTPAAADTAAVSATLPGADTGSGADLAVVSNTLIVGETPLTTEVGSVRLYDGDVGTATENVKVIANGATLAFGNDSASATETACIKISDGDTGGSLEVGAIGYQGALPKGPRILRIYPGDA